MSKYTHLQGACIENLPSSLQFSSSLFQQFSLQLFQRIFRHVSGPDLPRHIKQSKFYYYLLYYLLVYCTRHKVIVIPQFTITLITIGTTTMTYLGTFPGRALSRKPNLRNTFRLYSEICTIHNFWGGQN